MAILKTLNQLKAAQNVKAYNNSLLVCSQDYSPTATSTNKMLVAIQKPHKTINAARSC